MSSLSGQLVKCFTTLNVLPLNEPWKLKFPASVNIKSKCSSAIQLVCMWVKIIFYTISALKYMNWWNYYKTGDRGQRKSFPREFHQFIFYKAETFILKI